MALVDSNTVLSFMGSTYASATVAERAIADLVVPIACNLVKEEVGYEIELSTFTEMYPETSTPVDDDQLVYGWEVIGGKAVPSDYRTQRARAVLQLRNLPIRSITSIHESPSAQDTFPPYWSPTSQLTEGQHFRVDYEDESAPGYDPLYPYRSLTGHVVRRVGIWSPITRCVRVIYVAGYTALELAGRANVFVSAAIDAATFFVKEAKLNALKGGNTGMLTAETIGGWSQTFAPPAAMGQLGLQYALPFSAKRKLEKYVRMSKFITA